MTMPREARQVLVILEQHRRCAVDVAERAERAARSSAAVAGGPSRKASSLADAVHAYRRATTLACALDACCRQLEIAPEAVRRMADRSNPEDET